MLGSFCSRQSGARAVFSLPPGFLVGVEGLQPLSQSLSESFLSVVTQSHSHPNRDGIALDPEVTPTSFRKRRLTEAGRVGVR